ncbi:isoleucyl-trna synthetase [Diplodia corticola]|uniref:Isoleucine--tRNA ligase, mitochondrial n=1 Tax=Diplodia corticola TaxID=236234 RepID=A0A1J9SB60_9PEZI|nr:isoleucyl-trna synthetase [Diplodia corticola]OJD36821.1 isoleucyl-trna synthetase [Diplodia corticola]
MVAPSQVLRSAAATAAKSWSATLKLPKSAFPPRPSQSPDLLRQCTDDLYAWQQSPDRPATGSLVFHDGPPYANGSLHIGHALNKVLKDLICRFHVQQGKRVQYIPGWDCHGLPIELKALQALANPDRHRLSPVEVRAAARRLAERTVEEQKEGFKNWAIMGDWHNAYKTMEKGFEMRQLHIFKEMVEKGLIYRQFKPVYWSPSSGTALAEAELEYDDNHRSTTAYVNFPITKLPASLAGRVYIAKLGALIWTTTPWTLPANRAIAVHSSLEYCVVEMPRPTLTGHRPSQFLIAKDRFDALQETLKTDFKLLVDAIPGSELAGQTEYANPLEPDQLNAQPIIHADFVSAASGSGLVHLAPGHGMDDYDVCRSIGIDAFAPVDDQGCFTKEALPGQAYHVAGLPVQGDGSKVILDLLTTMPRDPLVAVENITHKYPIDWRTKQPVIIRATEQWFADVEEIKESALEALEHVEFHPKSARARLESFVRGRSQWCVSRQRAWGVPIPALYEKTESGSLKAHMTGSSIEHIMNVIEQRGIDAWWTDAEDEPAWIPEGLTGSFVRGKDTMDVWFDSGTAWTLLDPRPGQPVADVFLEGTDQHRGWFQSSLLTHISHQSARADAGDKSSHPKYLAPFKTLITHGFTLDQDGRKMSKSLGNTISPSQIMDGSLLPPLKPRKKQKGNANPSAASPGAAKPKETFDAMGADALRLWVASSDYTKDVIIGQPVLAAVNQSLHKYRVTFKWLLGVLSDFDPAVASSSSSSSSKTTVPNRWALVDAIALHQLSRASHAVHAAFAAHEFYRGTAALSRYTTADLSAFYFETLKDRLYAGTPADRAGAQRVLRRVFAELLDMLAPVCPLLVEEIWSHAPEGVVVAAEGKKPGRRTWTPYVAETWDDGVKAAGLEAKMEVLRAVGDAAKAAQEEARKEKLMGGGLECDVVLRLPSDVVLPGAVADVLRGGMEEDLAAVLVVSGVEIVGGSGSGGDDAAAAAAAAAAATDAATPAAREEGLESQGRQPPADWVFKAPFELPGVADKQAVAEVRPARRCKCPRCWRYVAPSPDVLCGRCEDVVGA